MQKVKSCCCGCTLKTGTLILLWLGVVLTVLTIVSDIAAAASLNVKFSNVLVKIVIQTIFLGIYAMGIYGVEKERPAFLTPCLALQVIGMVSIILGMVVVAVFGSVIFTMIAVRSQSEGKEASAATIIVFVEIGCVVALGLAYYFFIVVLSFYKELRGEISRK